MNAIIVDNPNPLTLDEAKLLKAGDVIHPLDGNGNFITNKSNTLPQRWVITSVKTWKRNPEQIRIKAQRGLYERAVILQYHLEGWHHPAKEATPEQA